jgi:hypothetical protein
MKPNGCMFAVGRRPDTQTRAISCRVAVHQHQHQQPARYPPEANAQGCSVAVHRGRYTAILLTRHPRYRSAVRLTERVYGGYRA